MSLTKSDFATIKKLVRLETDGSLNDFEIKFEQKLEEKLEHKLEEKLGRYPTKDEFYIAMDKLMKELETIRQELSLTPSHSDLADLEERVFSLEELHPAGKHLFTTPAP